MKFALSIFHGVCLENSYFGAIFLSAPHAPHPSKTQLLFYCCLAVSNLALAKTHTLRGTSRTYATQTRGLWRPVRGNRWPCKGNRGPCNKQSWAPFNYTTPLLIAPVPLTVFKCRARTARADPLRKAQFIGLGRTTYATQQPTITKVVPWPPNLRESRSHEGTITYKQHHFCIWSEVSYTFFVAA